MTTKLEITRGHMLAIKVAQAFSEHLREAHGRSKFAGMTIDIESQPEADNTRRMTVRVKYDGGHWITMELAVRTPNQGLGSCTFTAQAAVAGGKPFWQGMATEDETGAISLAAMLLSQPATTGV
jgi:hypothetical protein